MGTAGYMSPEQVRGKKADTRSDIFAFGAILQEMVTGERTFLKPTSAETLTAILNEDAPAITEFAPTAPLGSSANRAARTREKSGAEISVGLRYGFRPRRIIGVGYIGSRRSSAV